MDRNITVAERLEGQNSVVEILHYEGLSGTSDLDVARDLYFAHQMGMRLKQVRITLNNSAAILEAGALHFMKGNLALDANVGGLGGFAKSLVTNALTKETVIRPRYRGTGEIHLEPSFGHFLIIPITREELIVEKGMFYASDSQVDVGVSVQKNVSAGLFGGEGWVQTKLSGNGWCVLTSPVPSNEIVRYTLNNEKLSIDGTFALLRKGNIEFRVERSSKSLIGSAVSGEGVLQTFTGTGEVWLAPTQGIYRQLQAGIRPFMRPTVPMGSHP